MTIKLPQGEAMHQAPAPTIDDRRRSPRFRLELPQVAFCTLPGEGCRPLITRVTNLSRGGIGVVVPEIYEADWPALLKVITNLQINFDGNFVVECDAQIAWLGGIVRKGRTVFHSGLRFEDFDQSNEAWLLEYLEQVAEGT